MSPEAMGDLLIVMLPFVSAGVTFALSALGLYYSGKFRGNKLVQAMVLLDRIVIDVVKELNQTVVADLKAARADGKLTPDEAAQIKHKAVNLVLNRLEGDAVLLLKTAWGPLVDVIASKIEAAVFDCKKHKATGVRPQIETKAVAKISRI